LPWDQLQILDILDKMILQFPSHGLGVCIIKLSFLLATAGKSTAVVPNQDNLAFELKKIFCIPDSKLVIELGQHGHPDIESDELCTYAPYFQSEHVSVFGKLYPINKKRKPCVALTMHHNGGLTDPFGNYYMPYNKFATAEEYNRIFEKLTQSGYDVITMNQTGMTLEQKVYMLNEMCDFVLGYEGGLGHLAHLLGIPYFCLPWRFNDMGHPGVQPGLWLEAQRFHPDRRTWFLKDTKEFLSWTKSQLNEKINELYIDQGNNILFDADTTMDPATLKIQTKNGMDLTPRIMWCETRGAYTTTFVKEHLPLANMVKYPLKSMTYNT
jgi:hypothetical protein